jgi:hypothetical protein
VHEVAKARDEFALRDAHHLQQPRPVGAIGLAGRRQRQLPELPLGLLQTPPDRFVLDSPAAARPAGYANSFEDADFLKTGSDYLDLIRTHGIEHVNGHLEQWLSETTAKGSGDDITVGILIAPTLGPPR